MESETQKSSLQFSELALDYFITNDHFYSIKCYDKFISYFLPFLKNNKDAVDHGRVGGNTKMDNKYDGYSMFKIYNIQDEDEDVFSKDKVNILVSVENFLYWHHYRHYNKYGDFGNKYIDIYLYNHYKDFIFSDNYIVIPIIYLQLQYFNNKYLTIQPPIKTNFENKKFCLQISFPKDYSDVPFDNNYTIGDICNNVSDAIKQVGPIDYIYDYKDIISNESCYHSDKLLDIINQYKFVLCFENSIAEGYITEKIFNVFFSRSIPIYYGPIETNEYFNNDSFFNIRDFFLQKDNEKDDGISKAYAQWKQKKLSLEAFPCPVDAKQVSRSRKNDFINKLSILNNNKELYQQKLNTQKINKDGYPSRFDDNEINYRIKTFLEKKHHDQADGNRGI